MSRGTIVIYESVFEGQRREAMRRGEDVEWLRAGAGQPAICCWCGEPIELVDHPGQETLLVAA